MLAVLLLALEVLLHAGPHRGRRPQAQSVIEIEIAVETSPDVALEGSPELWASEGEVRSVEPRRGGGFVALYTPTRDTFPRVVILRASVSAGGQRRQGWLALPLYGSDELALRTKPDTRVRVELGGKVFGPVRSDAKGNARVHVEVPPGVRLATIHVRDAFGNATSREVDLAPPLFRCVAAVADREEAGPADPAPLSIEVFAVTPAGRPASIGDLKFSAVRGAVSLARAERPGVFRLSYRAPEDGGGADTVTVRAFGSSDALRIRLLPRAEPEPTVQHPTSSAAAHAASTLVRPAAASSKRSPFPFAFAAGMLLRAQSNLSHANGGGAAFELSGKLPRPPLAGIERLEAIARLEGFAFAAQTQQGPAPGDPLRRGSLQAFSLATGLRATVLTVGPADLHAAALAGALRSFDTVRVVGGPADGVQQQSARWGPLLATAGGASMRLGRGRVLAEAQFAFSPARGQLQGNLGGLSLSAGYLLDFN
jgi:hypothetical protein